ncbi:MAG: hypothetical protein IK045_09025 [Bacteroidales bacterium]|nr:hypothetical protein [Bacteroidales bacterium]
MKSKLILISTLFVMLSCSARSGWKHYAELAGAVYERPDSVLMVLEGSKAADGGRGEAEYKLLKEKSYILYYGIPDATDEGGAAEAIEYFSAKGPAPMKAEAYSLLGKRLVAENRYEDALKAYSAALHFVDWDVPEDPLAKDICRDMVSCYKVTGEDINDSEYLYLAWQGMNTGRVRTERARMGALLLLFTAIFATMVWYLKAKRMAADKELAEEKAETERYMSIAEELQGKVSRMKASGGGAEVLERLCAQYYVNEGSDRLGSSVVREVKDIIDGLRNDPKVQKELERQLNTSGDNVMLRLREEFPKWKEEDFRIYCYTASGFSSTTIATLIEREKPYVYNRLYRIKSSLSKSENSDFYLSFL